MHIRKLNQAGFNYIYLLIGVVLTLVIIAAAFGGILYMQDQNKKKAAQEAARSTVNRNDPFIRRYADNCIDTPINRLTNAPVATDQVRFIEPMGRVADTQVLPAVYATITPLNPLATASSYNLVMPANGKVVDVTRNAAGSAYDVVISYSCRYYTVFQNVPNLIPSIAAQLPTDMQPRASQPLNTSLKAGEPIGSFGNQPVQWIMVDAKATAQGLSNTMQYDQQPWIVHAIDPFSVYIKTTREQLQAKSLRSAEPIGGKFDYNKENTLSGNWFKTGTNGYAGSGTEPWLNFLSVAPNYIDPNSTIVSIGNWEGKPRQFTVKGKVDATTATKANSPVKYELMELTYLKPDGAVWSPVNDGFVKGLTVSQNNPVIGSIMFEVQDGNKIRLQRFPGKTADQLTVFEASAELYER